MEAAPRLSAALFALVVAFAVPSLAPAVDDERRPVRQVETDDGVIEITNSHAPLPDSTSEVTSVRSLRSAAARDEAKAADDVVSETLSPEAAPAPARASGAPSWLLPCVVLVFAAGVCVWGVRRRRSSREGLAEMRVVGPSHPRTVALDAREALEAEVLEAPGALSEARSDGALTEAAMLGGEQWSAAVRDSVPPSSPPRASRGANAPRQWVSQPLRVKPDDS